MPGGGRFIARHTKKVLTDDTKELEYGKELPVPELGEDFYPKEVVETNKRFSYIDRTKRVSQ